jgi:hypothetical protein
MKLDCVLTATNLNPLYVEFIPYFIRTWKKAAPSVDIKIVLIADEIPKEYEEYSQYIILFKPIEGISTAFISQYIRSLYPALLNYEGGVMITDMDIFPMDGDYYIKNIEPFGNEKFIYYRDVLLNEGQIAMCYNAATPQVWSEIFNIKTTEDIIQRLKDVNSKILYDNQHGSKGWYTDQIDLFQAVSNWNKNTNNFVYLKDADTKFDRLNREYNFVLNNFIITNIKNKVYKDYHAMRPHTKFKYINEKIFELL